MVLVKHQRQCGIAKWFHTSSVFLKQNADKITSSEEQTQSIKIRTKQPQPSLPKTIDDVVNWAINTVVVT